MSGVATAVAVAGAAASVYAANKQAGAAESAQQMQMDQYNQTRADLAPWRNAGKTALGQLGELTANGGDLNRNFTMADFQADPGYAFRMQQGLQAIQGSAAARGGLLSGGVMKDLSGYSQGLASQEYGNAFNRFETQNQDRYNRLAGLAGLGESATSATGQFGANAALNAGNFGMQGASAQAGGYLGAANTLGNAGQSWMNYQALNNLAQQQWANGYGSYMQGQIGAGSRMLGGSSYIPPMPTELPG